MGAIVDDIPCYCTQGKSPEAMENALFRAKVPMVLFARLFGKAFHDFYSPSSL
jgi:hypothetical protein